ncbi:MAG: TldD/PmbA family protein [Bacteroidales bacterium]|nr:TldD/PmbA family protein [Bacteroidales bacterium]
MNINEKYTLADMVMNHALKNGAEQVSVSINDSRSSNIEVRDQKIDKLTESIRNSLTIKLFVDKKYSAHSTNRMKEKELFHFVEEGIAATRFLAEDEFRSLPDPELYYKGGSADLNVMDPKLDSLEAKTKIDLANQVMNEAFQKDSRIISVSSYYSDNISNRVLVTSNGFKGDSNSSNISLYADVSVNGGKGRPSDYWYENAIFFDKLKRTDIGKKALERALQKIGPKKIKSGKYPVVIENRTVSSILNPLYSALFGSSIYKKQSFLIGKENKPVASQKLTVIDDPFIPSGFGSQLFDSEGLAAVKRPIIEEGILRNYYIDNYYGRKLKMKPTSGDTSNVIFTTGERDLAGMIQEIKKGILITGFNGGNCNGSTGDFSYGIEGFFIENGKIVHPVNEMNISGNMNHFWLNLVETGNDVLENDSIKTPSMMFDNIDFSGI